MLYIEREVSEIPEGWDVKRRFFLTDGYYYKYHNGDEYREHSGKCFVVDKVNPRKHLESSHIWDSWFDTSTGEVIDSMDKIREKERNGQVFCSDEEAKAESRKQRKHIDAEYSKGEQQRFNDRMMPVLKRQGII